MIAAIVDFFLRFDDLKKSLVKMRKKKSTIAAITLLLFTYSSFAQHTSHQQSRFSNQQIDSILKANLVNEKHAESFNKLIIQDAG